LKERQRKTKRKKEKEEIAKKKSSISMDGYVAKKRHRKHRDGMAF